MRLLIVLCRYEAQNFPGMTFLPTIKAFASSCVKSKGTRIALLFVLLTAAKAWSQPYWFQRPGSPGNDEALDVTHDAAGNVVATGYFTQAVSFSGTPLFTSSVSDVFVAKYTAAGALIWAKQCGGTGADRGLSVRTDNTGNVYVTGYFTGTATFGSISLTATSGSQDIFACKLDPSGNFLWARSFGGGSADVGNGITADASGNAIVTGQYMGTVNFGSGYTLSSMINPGTGSPSYDAFVVKLDASGNTLWAKSASAKFDDRGMDVDCDASGNIFVTGQFSDTLTIDLVHYNTVLNAGFVFKLNSAGTETGFCRLSSGQTVPYSIDIDMAGRVNVCGDHQGALVVSGSPSVTVPGPSPKNIFIVRFDASLDVLWSAHAGSASEVSARSIITDAAGNVYISGIFKCRFDDYGDTFGPGMFYSVGFRDVFAARYDNTGNFNWAKNCGGPKDDFCSGIALTPGNKPVLAGSMNESFNFVSVPGIFPEIIYSMTPCPGIGQDYIVYKGPAILRDIFIGSFMDMSPNLLDIFDRFPDCSADFLEPILNEPGPDTLHACSGMTLQADVQNIEPLCNLSSCFTYLWHTGSTASSIGAPVAGWYSVTVTRQDLCYSNTDSVYVEISPVSPPLITDSYGENILEPPYADPITICGNDTIILTASNVWSGPGYGWYDVSGANDFIPINDSVIAVNQTGNYYFVNANEYGCLSTNSIQITMDTFALTDTLHPYLTFAGAGGLTGDSISICSGFPYFTAFFNDTTYYNGYSMPYKYVDWYFGSPLPASFVGTSYVSEMQNFVITASGWYDIYAHLENECAEDTINYWVHDSVYVEINPGPVIAFSFNPDEAVCPYDTSYHTFSTNAQNVMVYSSCIYWAATDSTVTTYGTGTVNIVLSSIDPVTGCSAASGTSYSIPPYPVPEIDVIGDGLVCPGDSVQIIATDGLSYTWSGPGLTSADNGQSIYVNTPGFYYCIVTDTNGCVLATNTIETNEYGTPFIQAGPDIYFCPGETITLTVNGSPGTTYNWLPPIVSTMPSITVSTGGTYTCEVSSCGIVTAASITVYATGVPAVILAPDTVLCPGETLTISAAPGMDSYSWSPLGSSDSVITVSTPGTYTLTITEGACTNTNSVTVINSVLPGPPVLSDVNICPGTSALLSSGSSTVFNWYDSDGNLLYTGTDYNTPALSTDTVFYAQAINADGCTGPQAPVEVIIIHDPAPVLTVNGHCEGEPVSFSSNVSGTGADFYWFGPAGYVSSDPSPVIAAIPLSGAGVYGMYYSSAPGCISDTGYITVTLDPAPLASIDPFPVEWCQDVPVVFSAQTGTGYQYSWLFPDSDSLGGNPVTAQVGNAGQVVLVVTDANGCHAYDSVFANVIAYPVILMNAPDQVCLGEDLLITVTVDQYDTTLLYGPGLYSDSTFAYTIPATDSIFTGVYGFYASFNGCADSVSRTIAVIDHPLVSLGGDTTMCPGTPVNYDLDEQYSYSWSNGENGAHVGIDAFGTFWVTLFDSETGCSHTDSVVIEPLNCEVAFPNIFTPDGDGINDHFRPFTEGVTNLELVIYNRWGNKMYTTVAADAYWDGRDSDGKLVSPGVYFFTARVTLINNQVVPAHGTVQVSYE